MTWTSTMMQKTRDYIVSARNKVMETQVYSFLQINHVLTERQMVACDNENGCPYEWVRGFP